jgi:hypothetical protein
MRWLLLMGTALIAFTSNAVGQNALPTGDYRLAEMRALGSLEIGSVSVRDGRFMARAVSDLMVRLDERRSPPARGSLAGAPTAGERSLELRLFMVMAGRIAEVGHARCAPSQSAVIACVLDCDGGMIGLSFPSATGGSARPALLVGANGDDGGTGVAGIRLGACGGQQALVARPRGNRAEVRVPLEPMRAGVGAEQAPAVGLPTWGPNEATGSVAARAFSLAPGAGSRQHSTSVRD